MHVIRVIGDMLIGTQTILSIFHINVKETLSAVFAVRRWGHHLRNSKVLFITDSTTARANISKGSACDPELLPWLRELHYQSVIFNFDIVSTHIPGEFMPADDVSRLSHYGHLRNFMSSHNVCDYHSCVTFLFTLDYHMSRKTALFICQQVSNRDSLIQTRVFFKKTSQTIASDEGCNMGNTSRHTRGGFPTFR